MILTLCCGPWRAAIAARGAQLQSLQSAAYGRELIWQGDPAVWADRSPLLFPIVGRLREDRYLAGGRAVTLPKHGFARDADFAAEQVSPRCARFTLTDSPAFWPQYPFRFRLSLTYTLGDEGLCMAYEVQNPGDEILPFSLGAHPGFFCSPGDFLLFEEEETAYAHRLDENRLLTEADTPVFDTSRRRVLLTETRFDWGALIVEHPRSREVTLCRADGSPGVRLSFSAPPPCLGLWAFPRAPYVCVEPWHGLDDTPGPVRALTEKPCIQTLPPQGVFRWSMTVSSA